MGCSFSVPSTLKLGKKPTKPAAGAIGVPDEALALQAYGANAYELVGQLGTGKTGTMKLMKNKKTKELVAAKFVERVAGAGLSKNTEREIVNHRRLLHPNIIRFYEVFMTDEALVIVMEYASGGNIEKRVSAGGSLAEDKARDLFLQLASALEYCHSRSIYHRDLSLENIHLDGSHFAPQLKLTGFGYSKSAVLDSQPKTNVGSPVYTPPELLLCTRNDGTAYDGGSNDVWSAGIILYYMLTGSMPFMDATTPGALNRKMMQRIINVEYTLPPELNLSRECEDFISKIFTKSPKERIRTADMRHHPWLAGTSLPSASRLDESPQTELEIHKIVEKARQRRRSSTAQKPPDGERHRSNAGQLSSRSSRSGAPGELGSKPSRPNGVNGHARSVSGPKRTLSSELGIAEVPKEGLSRKNSRV